MVELTSVDGRRTEVVPPLIDGGVMLSYRCTNRCRHCAYRCAPDRPDHWMSDEMLRTLFDRLSEEPRLHSVHLAGGEAMLRPERVLKAIALARGAGVRLSYLETNAAWVRGPDHARRSFADLADAGLPAVLISASPFHNEFIPFVKTRQAVTAAEEVFGRGGVIVWIPPMYRALEPLDENRTHTLDEFFDATGLTPSDVPDLYPLTVHGRVVEELREGYTPQPAAYYADQTCRGELSATSHFHIDPYGWLFVGHCPGIAAGSVGELHPRPTPQTHPGYLTCFRDGPYGLYRRAVDRYGYRETPEGYVSKCDLCFHVRRHLHACAGEDYPDLQPGDFYR